MERVVYGANCVWWDTIANVGKLQGGEGISLPCCPHCNSVLFEIPDEETWWKSVDEHEAKGNPGYRKFVEWLRGKCFRNYREAKAAYERQVL